MSNNDSAIQIAAKKMQHSLNMQCMKFNMIEFIDEYGYELADKKLANLFGKNYTDYREELYQWYDFEISGECNNVK